MDTSLFLNHATVKANIVLPDFHKYQSPTKALESYQSNVNNNNNNNNKKDISFCIAKVTQIWQEICCVKSIWSR